jgi:cytochrome subunit of sulfide dehydrogenase
VTRVTDSDLAAPDSSQVGDHADSTGGDRIMSQTTTLGLRRPAGAIFCGALSLALCAAAQAQTTTPPAGRLLASNCFQCHGTNGKGPGFESIAGQSASELYATLKEYQAGKEGNGIMARHAMGYTDAQLHSLAQWLSTQK